MEPGGITSSNVIVENINFLVNHAGKEAQGLDDHQESVGSADGSSLHMLAFLRSWLTTAISHHAHLCPIKEYRLLTHNLHLMG